MDWIIRSAGVLVILTAIADIFLTVLYARSNVSLITPYLSRWIWIAFRKVDNLITRGTGNIASACGPFLLLLIVALWTALILVGFALLYWPSLGEAITSSKGETSKGFVTAIYYSGFNVTTLGMGDIVPNAGWARILTIIEAWIGFTFITLTVTYFTSIYGAVQNRNTTALELHMLSGESGRVEELVQRIHSQDSQETTFGEIHRDLLTLFEAAHQYPIIYYFRYRPPYYSGTRLLLLCLDAVDLSRCAFDAANREKLNRSGTIDAFMRTATKMLENVYLSVLPNKLLEATRKDVSEEAKQQWREHYRYCVSSFLRAGLPVRDHPEKGEDDYIRRRIRWDPSLQIVAQFFGEKWDEIEPPPHNKETMEDSPRDQEITGDEGKEENERY